MKQLNEATGQTPSVPEDSGARVSPIDWTKYPMRRCLSLHTCRVCAKDITLWQEYYDGGYSRRAHVPCAAAR